MTSSKNGPLLKIQKQDSRKRTLIGSTAQFPFQPQVCTHYNIDFIESMMLPAED